MNIRFLETFLWVARLRSFSAAAERLNTTQAAISSRIATLERDLGARLFDRDPRSVRLSPEGEKALARAETIVRMTHELREQIGDGHGLRGTITIGTIDTVVYTWLPHLLERLKARYPGVSLDLAVDTSIAVARQLQERHLDLALIVGPVHGSDLINIEIMRLDYGWFAAPKLDLPDRPCELSDVLAFPLIGYSKGSQPYHATMRMLTQAGIDIESVRIFNTNSLATIIRLAVSGAGIAMVPKAVVHEQVARRELVEVSVKINVGPMPIHAVYAERPDNPLPAAVAAMAAEIAREQGMATRLWSVD
jgi:DNA-binding transcriptional LysR family regulator